MAGEHERRCLAAQRAMATRGVDCLVVAPSSDLIYLAGIAVEPSERLLALVLLPFGPPTLVLPRLEATKLAEVAAFASLAVWEETEDPVALVARLVTSLGADSPVVAVGERTFAGTLLRLQRALPEATFVSADAILAELRLIKSPAEVALMRAAGAMADEAYVHLLGEKLSGRTETEVADLLAGLLRRAGQESVSFVIVGSGPNSAAPHHAPGGRRLAPGDVVVLDFGGTHEHYQSDMTRTIAVGEPPSAAKRVYELVAQAQEVAFRTVRPGVTASEVDAAARAHLTAAGFGDLFIHRTGHGLGLDVHEEPYIVAGNPLPLREGMVFSIEPGVYLPGEFGVRVEDIVVVTADGAERLNNAPREFFSLG